MATATKPPSARKLVDDLRKLIAKDLFPKNPAKGTRSKMGWDPTFYDAAVAIVPTLGSYTDYQKWARRQGTSFTVLLKQFWEDSGRTWPEGQRVVKNPPSIKEQTGSDDKLTSVADLSTQIRQVTEFGHPDRTVEGPCGPRIGKFYQVEIEDGSVDGLILSVLASSLGDAVAKVEAWYPEGQLTAVRTHPEINVDLEVLY